MKHLALIAFLCARAVFAQETFASSSALDAVVDAAVREGVIPGAVLVVGHQGKIVHRKAYGSRALVPSREAMTVDTIFDVASLTKVVATTPSIMKLFEQGKIRINDPVTAYLPDFQSGKSGITVRDLMTHFSGLRPDLSLTPAWNGYQTGIQKALIDKPTAPPGVRFTYSDINFELLGEIVQRVSGRPLDEFAREQIFRPLGMNETFFLNHTGYHPPKEWTARIAPTEVEAGAAVRGIVNDPTARAMGGVAGHAGVFSTASDLAKYAQMLIDDGASSSGILFSPATVRKFTTSNSPPDQHILRGLGWDIDSGFSAPRGELFPVGSSYGHTGFTGTSMWLDPGSKTYVILLTNSVHPYGTRKSLSPLRSKVATIVAAAFMSAPGLKPRASYDELESEGVRRMSAANLEVMTGIDVLEQDGFAALMNRRVGLITNQTGLDREGRRNVDAMLAAGVKVTALFTPEHGITGKQDQPDIDDGKDAATGIPVWSLYQNSRYRRPAALTEGVDALAFDMQDAGTRFYTYSCTMVHALEDAAKSKIPFYVLDRPNPISGMHMEGPLLEESLDSPVGCYSLPVRHGMTLGELATMVNAERKLGAELHVIKMKNWQRNAWFDSTGLTWTDPSPNLRSLNAAALYPGLAMLEASPDYSVGRGSDAPFEQIGAAWIKGAELARFLNTWVMPGVRVYATKFEPRSGPFAGKTIEGVRFVILNREQLNAVRVGLDVAYALERLYPGKINFEACRYLIGNRETVAAMKAAVAPGIIEQNLLEAVGRFEQRRMAYLLY